MKKMKKLLAMSLAMSMVLGMSMTTFAAKPDATNFVTAKVENVEAGAEVKAYQIIEGDYGTNGFLGYKEVSPQKGTLVDIIEGTYLDKVDDRPTAEEVVQIAKDINDGKLKLEVKNVVEMKTTAETGLATYTGDLKAGYWVVLVRGTTNVYNPMLIGVYYDSDTEAGGIQGSGDDNILVPNPSVDATSNWTLVATDAYAKSSTPTIIKTADVATQNAGGTVNFDVKTAIPDYSGEYVDNDATTTDVVFVIKDTLQNLTLNTDSIKVTVGGNVISEGDTTYTVDPEKLTENGYEISFTQDFILEHGRESVLVEYSAILTDAAINNVPGENKVELTYTNNPGQNEGYDFDIEKVYSFDIDGDATKQIITKVKKGETETTTAPLAGATFTLYTDADCTLPYSNTSAKDELNANGEVVSDKDGQIHISGLDLGTYYIRETKAPVGYSLNDTIYKIDITAEFNGEELVSWKVKVTDLVTGEDKDSTFTVNSEAEIGSKVIDETPVMNIKLIALPSTGGIGTTIFTVSGCAIMIAAAYFFMASRRKEEQ